MRYIQGEEVQSIKGSLKQDGFPVYRQSSLKNYYTCPHMFHLAQTLPEEVVSGLIESRNTKMGLLFEGYVFGFKTPESEIKGIGKDVKERLKSAAEYVRNYPLKSIIQFGNGTKLGDFFADGMSYYDQMVVGKRMALTGEADFFHKDFGFFDLKHTEDISNAGWTNQMQRHEKLQSIVYPYLRFKGTGERHPFYYIVVETKYETPIVRAMYYKPTDDDFNWLEEQLNLIHDDPFYHPNEGEYSENCLSQRYGKSRARCKFMQHCEHGRSILGGFHEVKFVELEMSHG